LPVPQRGEKPTAGLQNAIFDAWFGGRRQLRAV
jgi:hypothetical protein